MRIRFLCLLLFFTIISCSREQVPLAVKGILDLRNIPVKDHFVVKLNGEWEFYWNKMLYPHDFKSGNIIPGYFGTVPSFWTDYPDSVKTEKYGYATYRLRVLLPPGFKQSLAFDLPVFDSSYDIYVNGKYSGGNGQSGKSASESRPEYKRNFFRFNPDSDSLDVIINVSNFHHRHGGFWLPAKLGTFPDIQKRLANSWAAEWSMISMLTAFSLFYFFFFMIYPRDRTMGFFSLLAIGLASRPLFSTHYLILNIYPVSWEWLVRFEYTGLFFIIISLSWFAVNLYPSGFGKLFVKIITVTFSIISILTVILPVRIFSYSDLIYYPSILFLIFYMLGMNIKGLIKKIKIEIIYNLTFLLLLAGALNDILVSMGRSHGGSGYLLPYSLVLFIFIQAILLIYKWIGAFQDKEKIQSQIEFMNRNLEVLIKDRTRELQTRNEEIEKQNSRIALQNKKLSDTIQLKNRIFSVIAHDLRGPVVNILYMLNLLKEKEYKIKYDSFANSSIQYAQNVISLLENMLVWGRGQEEKIKFSPGNHDIADIILTNLSIFKETADKKEIVVNFTQVGGSIAYIDKDLLDIIIRNLLSNAVKYTPRKGRISIFLKDKGSTGEGMKLKICDNGVGISEKRQKHIFTSEEVESTPGTENEKGTGLGLRLCYELVKINKGDIIIESKDNEGTCFVITLPVTAQLSNQPISLS